MKQNELKVRVGIGEIKFGMTSDQVSNLVGKPDEEEVEEIDEVSYTVWHYNSRGYSLFFDSMEDDKLLAIEASDSDVELKGKPIFELDESELKSHLKEQGFSIPEEEQLEDGDSCLSYEKEEIDFYFDTDGQLLAMHMSVPMDDDLEIIWPS